MYINVIRAQYYQLSNLGTLSLSIKSRPPFADWQSQVASFGRSGRARFLMPRNKICRSRFIYQRLSVKSKGRSDLCSVDIPIGIVLSSVKFVGSWYFVFSLIGRVVGALTGVMESWNSCRKKFFVN